VAITVGLATLHTSLLVLVVLTVIYLAGELGSGLDGLNTFAGLGLFAYLLAITWVATAGALRRIGWPDSATYGASIEAAMYWGGGAGAAFLIVGLGALAVGLVGASVVELDPGILIGVALLIPVGAIGGAVAAAVGGLVGILLGFVDYALRWLSELALDSLSPEDSAPRE
jgi:hypothetical protein